MKAAAVHHGAGGGLVVSLLLVLAACSTPSPSPKATPLPSNPDGMPAGNIIQIDIAVEMSADDRTVILRFIGGEPLPAGDPCETEYVGWARPQGIRLEVAVVQVVDGHAPPGSAAACSAAGFNRQVEVRLDKPFLGTIVIDRFSGHIWKVNEPSPSG